MRRLAPVLLALALVATGCPRTRVEVRPTGTASPRPPSVEVVSQNVRLVPGPERAVRFGFVPADSTVRVIVTFPDTGSIVAACAVERADAAPPPDLVAPHCREELPSGVREELSVPARLAAVAVWVRTGNAVTASIRLEYAQGARPRPVRIELPVINAPQDPTRCKDNACNPVFEVRPVRGGRFHATGRWTGASARLALLQGRVLAKSFTATGIPYTVAAAGTGAAGARIETRLSAPAEYALVVDGNRADLTGIVVETEWP